MRVGVWSLLVAGSLALPGDRVQAVGIEQASRIYLNHAAALMRQAQRYVSRSHATYALPGFDYEKCMREVDTVGDGVETFLNPRPGDPGQPTTNSSSRGCSKPWPCADSRSDRSRCCRASTTARCPGCGVGRVQACPTQRPLACTALSRTDQ